MSITTAKYIAKIHEGENNLIEQIEYDGIIYERCFCKTEPGKLHWRRIPYEVYIPYSEHNYYEYLYAQAIRNREK